MVRKSIICIFIMFVSSGSAATDEPPTERQVEAKTIFVDVTAFNRRKGAAKQLTEIYTSEHSLVGA